jgi:hypothetical protein
LRTFKASFLSSMLSSESYCTTRNRNMSLFTFHPWQLPCIINKNNSGNNFTSASSSEV